ncbi:unnamed protein product [Clonostachys rosea]|uniref:Knr4/Smi1-like domain-containing protein n=1 Tax=Bionectria ochroleuca TaxID=29856 RepID=A0ABY6ULH4_BIOOC|nr:unnamed protein product [Clonostachys rosea]
MVTLSYIDEADHGEEGYFVQHTIPDLVSLLLEPADATEGLRKICRLVELLLLSNQIDQAYALFCAVHEYQEAILPPSSVSDHALRITSRPFAHFLEANPTYAYPGKTPEDPEDPDAASARRKLQQWNEYRECTRTGWMLEHCNLPEPEDPHTWKETDDEAMIAMCARLLAKDKMPGKYPNEERLREALDAAKKLYAHPQVPITEWDLKLNRSKKVWRHSYLLYRRLVVEVAIRLGELETAADVLSMGLRLDGFNYSDGGQLDRYLALPGIYDVLPLLAKKGKEGSPFYIETEDADAIVKDVKAALELRAREGRQWSLAPEKVGWRELLDRLAKGAWAINRKEYEEQGLTRAEDILHPPATEEEIAEAEAKVGELPPDFKEMVRIANGFDGGWFYLGGGINGLEDIRQADDDLGNYMWSASLEPDGDVHTKGIELEPATGCDGFMHFMISPAHWRNSGNGRSFKEGEYPYWQWVHWKGGEEVWNSFRDWVASEVESAEAMVKKGRTLDDDE